MFSVFCLDIPRHTEDNLLTLSIPRQIFELYDSSKIEVEDDQHTMPYSKLPYWPKEEKALFEKSRKGGHLKKALKNTAVELKQRGEGPLARAGEEFSEHMVLVWSPIVNLYSELRQGMGGATWVQTPEKGSFHPTSLPLTASSCPAARCASPRRPS